MDPQSLQAKQHFLHRQIIEQQFDPEQFQQFMDNQKGLDLDQYSMDELVRIVRQFKGSVIEPSSQIDNAYHSPYQHDQHDDEVIHQDQQNDGNITDLGKPQHAPESPPTSTAHQTVISEKQAQQQVSKQQKPQLFRDKSKGKKFQIDLKQMIIPQYKPSGSKLTQQKKVQPKPEQPKTSTQQKNILNMVNVKFQQKQKANNATQSKKQINKDPAISVKQVQVKKNQPLTRKVQQQNLQIETSVYEDEQQQDEEPYDRGFIGGNVQSGLEFSESQSMSMKMGQNVKQSIYIPSGNNKLPYVIVKRQTHSTLYKQLHTPSSLIQIKIRSFSKKQSNSIFKFSYISYQIQTTITLPKQKSSQKSISPFKKQWKVERRFNDFKWLHQFLLKSYYGLPIPPIPSKTKMRSFSDQHLEQRMIIFERFLNKCLRINDIASDAVFEAFLSIEAREQFEAVKKKFDAKIKNRDENIMEFMKGEQILSYKQGKSSIPQQTHQFFTKTSSLLQSLNYSLSQAQIHLKLASQHAVNASSTFRQLSTLFQPSSQHPIKHPQILDLTNQYINQLSFKLDNEAYHLKNYVADIWMYEEMYTKNLISRMNSLDRHKTVLQTKFKEYHSAKSLEMYQESTQQQANSKYLHMYKKTRQLYEINLSLTLQEITRHLQYDMLYIAKYFQKGIGQYVDRIKQEMMTGVDLMTKSITLAEGKQIKQVQLIGNLSKQRKNTAQSKMIMQE